MSQANLATAPSFYDAPVPVDFVSPMNRYNWNIMINYKNHESYHDSLQDCNYEYAMIAATNIVEYPNDVAAIIVVRQ